jgi:hypothetical protein
MQGSVPAPRSRPRANRRRGHQPNGPIARILIRVVEFWRSKPHRAQLLHCGLASPRIPATWPANPRLLESWCLLVFADPKRNAGWAARFLPPFQGLPAVVWSRRFEIGGSKSLISAPQAIGTQNRGHGPFANLPILQPPCSQSGRKLRSLLDAGGWSAGRTMQPGTREKTESGRRHGRHPNSAVPK